MICSEFDWKAYLLGDLDRREALNYDDHARACSGCQQEWERLQLTHSALLSMGEEEIPRRIAFVSDKIFERPWWQTLWSSGPAMGFASAALLAAAILVHGFVMRPPAAVVAQFLVPAPVTAQVSAAPLDTAAPDFKAMERRIQAEVERREDAKHRELRTQAAALASAQETIRMYQNQMGRLMVAANYRSSE